MPIHPSAERWLHVLATGVLDGREDEEAAVTATKIVGEAKLSELREWFATQTKQSIALTEAAVIEGCIAMMHADHDAGPEERAAIERMIARADAGAETQAALRAAMEKPPRIEAICARVTHPVLRELLLVLAWELAKADGTVSDDERGEYGVLAVQLGITPERAAELRKALG